MRFLRSLGVLALCGTGLYAQQEAADIMHRVAENQDRAEKQRSEYIYEQDVDVASRHNNGKLICQQDTVYTVTPKETSSEHTFVSTRLKCNEKGKVIDSDKDPGDGAPFDSGIVKSFRDGLVDDKAKDGMGQDLFPLTSEHQKDMDFQLTGERIVNGRRAYVIDFRPKNHKDYGWAGEAVIDAEEFEPVTVYTRMSRKIPFFVRTMLGTDVPGLGFSTQYVRVDKGLWFPASFGSEFKIHAVYFFHRTITISVENKNFRRTDVESRIQYGGDGGDAK